MDKYPNRRRFLKALAAGTTSLAGAVLVACGSSSNTAASAAGSAPAATRGRAGGGRAITAAGSPAAAPQSLQQVRALAWSNGPAIDDNFKKRVAAFNTAQQGKVEVDLQFLPYDQ